MVRVPFAERHLVKSRQPMQDVARREAFFSVALVVRALVLVGYLLLSRASQYASLVDETGRLRMLSKDVLVGCCGGRLFLAGNVLVRVGKTRRRILCARRGLETPSASQSATTPGDRGP